MTKQELIDLRKEVSQLEIDVEHDCNIIMRADFIANPSVSPTLSFVQAWLDTESKRLELTRKRRRMKLETAMFLLEYGKNL